MRKFDSLFGSLILALACAGISSGQESAEKLSEKKTEASATNNESSKTSEVNKSSAPPQLVKLEDIEEHVGKDVTVEYQVKSSTLIDAKKICFLNSKKDYRKKGNFTVVIKSDTLEEFAMKEVANPAKHYYGKKIRVYGKVAEHRGKPQLLVTKFEQIKVIDSLPTEQATAEEKAKVAGVVESSKN